MAALSYLRAILLPILRRTDAVRLLRHRLGLLQFLHVSDATWTHVHRQEAVGHAGEGSNDDDDRVRSILLLNIVRHQIDGRLVEEQSLIVHLAAHERVAELLSRGQRNTTSRYTCARRIVSDVGTFSRVGLRREEMEKTPVASRVCISFPSLGIRGCLDCYAAMRMTAARLSSVLEEMTPWPQGVKQTFPIIFQVSSFGLSCVVCSGWAST